MCNNYIETNITYTCTVHEYHFVLKGHEFDAIINDPLLNIIVHQVCLVNKGYCLYFTSVPGTSIVKPLDVLYFTLFSGKH